MENSKLEMAEYPKWFAQERESLRAAGKSICRISHVGSTAVPGLLARPVVDILIELNRDSDIKAIQEKLKAAGYHFVTETEKPIRQLIFLKEDSKEGMPGQTYQLYIRYLGDWDELYFRDYLIKHSAVADDYRKLKLVLSQNQEQDKAADIHKKAAFISEYTKKARTQYQGRYCVYEICPQSQVAGFFAGAEDTLILSCLQGHVGRAYANSLKDPASVQLVTADFCFFGGVPSEALVSNLPSYLPSESLLMIPPNEQWAKVIEKCYRDKAEKFLRYAIKKEPNIFDREKLAGYVAALPKEYSLSMLDERLFYETRKQEWSADLTSAYSSYEQYRDHGIGVIASLQGIPVAGASAYTYYDDGIEIEIDTAKEHRGKGLALACGARLILECLDRKRYPSWDAHDLRSVALAEKLGYHMDKAYDTYYVRRCMD